MSLVQRLIQKVDNCTIEVVFNKAGQEGATITVPEPYDDTKPATNHVMFLSDENVEGKIIIKPQKRISHQGIKVELIGQISITNEREERSEFAAQCHKHDEGGGELKDERTIPFVFDCPKQHESYRGLNARVGYFVKVTVIKGLKNVVHREEIWVHKIDPKHKPLYASDNTQNKAYFKQKDFTKGVSMEVGVDDMLHIEFKYDKKIFHLQERVLGQVTFKVASLDLQVGEVAIVKREYIGVGENQFYESETLQKYEIMDGTPIPGEIVPIRLYLKSVPRLTPTYELVNNTFSVKYYVNLVLITGEGKRYFKQQEIILYRKADQGRLNSAEVVKK